MNEAASRRGSAPPSAANSSGCSPPINRAQVEDLFRLRFLDTHTNVLSLGGVGLGKTLPAIALGHAACLAGHTVRFVTAVDLINTLTAAQIPAQVLRETVPLAARQPS